MSATTPPGPTIDQLADIARARRDAMDAETLVACPWCCGDGMVSAEVRTEWLKAHPELREKADES